MDWDKVNNPKNIVYGADAWALHTCHWNSSEDDFVSNGEKWKASTFMPREIARYTPKILSIKIERLLDITEEAALAEGMKIFEFAGFDGWIPKPDQPGWTTARECTFGFGIS